LFVDGQTDGHLRPTLLGRFTGGDLKMSNLAAKWRIYRLQNHTKDHTIGIKPRKKQSLKSARLAFRRTGL